MSESCCCLSLTVGAEMEAGVQLFFLKCITRLRPQKILEALIKIVAIVCLFPSFLEFSRKLPSVIKHHYHPLTDIYLETTPFLFSSRCQS